MEPTANDVAIVARDLPVPMRDGTVLLADLYRPATGGPWPVLIQRTPYNKSSLIPVAVTLDPVRACREGFAVLFQDVRGRYKSPGEFYPYRYEEADGYDTVEWAACQPWCNGKVGVFGRSYAGATTWLAAVSNPPHLQAIVPLITASEYCEGWTYRQGALENSFILGWLLGELGIELPATGKLSVEEYSAVSDRLSEALNDPSVNLWDDVVRFHPYVRDWLDRPYDESYWGGWAIWPRLHKDIVPSLSIGAWFDMFTRGTFDLYGRLQALEGAAERRALMVGPWAHVNPLSQIVGDVDYGLRAAGGICDVQGATLNWFRRWLIGPEHARPMPRVQAFVMGVNRWVSGDTWPLGKETEHLYLTSTTGANGLDGDGRLVRATPAEGRTDSTIYRASDPVRSLGGGVAPRAGYRPGGSDQRAVERRPDVLVYTSEPLERPLTIVGAVTATIHAAAAEGELDVVVKLVDVAPDGFARNVADGIARSQHVAPQADRSGNLVAYTVDLGPTANTFAAGHRIRVDVAHSNYPHFDLNPLARDGTKQTIAHGGACASRVTLPVVTS